MKKTVLYMLLFSVVFSIFAPLISATDLQYGRIKTANGKGSSVRSGPGTNKYDRLSDGIGEGDLVKIMDTVSTNDKSTGCSSNKWYKIEFNEVTSNVGYVCSSFVEIIEIKDDNEFEKTLLFFPKSYHSYLKVLHSVYPNATFEARKTGLDFNDVIDNEDGLGKSLIWDSYPNNSRDGLKHLDSYIIKTNNFKNNYPGGGDNWYAASSDTISFYVDPRNFLTESRVFMFETLSYNKSIHKIDGVKDILSDSFMDETFVDNTKKTFAEVIMNAGIKYNISPYHIASRIRLETGSTRSALVKGTYPDYGTKYNGYYNFFNYGASGDNVVLNGLKYAYNAGWNSEEKSITGGVEKIGSSYISRGQNTLYFQKWDVVCKSDFSNKYDECGYYRYQYMQNIEAPYKEAYSTYDAYKDNLGDNMYLLPYMFTIPVYENMPESTSLPSSLSPIIYLTNITIDGKKITNFDYEINDYEISIPSSKKSINIKATSASSKAKISGIGNISITGDKQVIPITVTAANGNKLVYNLTINLTIDNEVTLDDTLEKLSNNVVDGYLNGITTVYAANSMVSEANSLARVKIYDNDKKEVTSGSLGTGYIVEITVGSEKKQYEVVIFGDINGDTKIDILDLLRLQKQLLSSINLKGVQLKSCDIDKKGDADVFDLLLIRKHLLGSSSIKQ